MQNFIKIILCLALTLVSVQASDIRAETNATLRVAVASNFLTTARMLGEQFHEQTGIKVLFSSASSGKITTQIEAGAPYDLFLSADMARPERLVQRGYALPESLATYAIGRLILVSREPLKEPLTFNNQRLAIANPKIAPYGLAAEQWLNKGSHSPKLILGENINQVWHFFQVGAVPFAIVAASQVQNAPKQPAFNREINVDQTILAQGLVILKRTNYPDAAELFRTFILSDTIQTQIVASGYDRMN